jgi:hypothetical protein
MKNPIALYSNLENTDFKTIGIAIYKCGLLFTISTDGSLWYHVNDKNKHYYIFAVELSNMTNSYILSLIFLWVKVSFVWPNS